MAEEAPGAHKDVTEVIQATHAADLAHSTTRMEPLICIEG
ncbi:RtcB family protein [Thioflavicoccus mobilis]|nr:RtcB family protein [Thioflavicoccus mobilis]